MNSYTKIVPASHNANGIVSTAMTMHRGNQRLWLQNAPANARMRALYLTLNIAPTI
jgi:hypothetical protein